MATLPAAERDHVEAFLQEHGFGDYRQLESELAARGIQVSRSSLQRYGAPLERRLAALRAATEQARIIKAESEAGGEDVSRALGSLIQTRLFDALLKLEETDDLSIGQIAQMAGNLERVGLARERHVMELESRLKRANAIIENATPAGTVGEIARKQGVSSEVLEKLRRVLTGEPEPAHA